MNPNLLMQAVINAPAIGISLLPKTGDREHFLVHLTDSQNAYSFQLSIRNSAIASWGVDPANRRRNRAGAAPEGRP